MEMEEVEQQIQNYFAEQVGRDRLSQAAAEEIILKLGYLAYKLYSLGHQSSGEVKIGLPDSVYREKALELLASEEANALLPQPAKQPAAILALGAEAGFLQLPERTVFFTNPTIQAYFCLQYWQLRFGLQDNINENWFFKGYERFWHSVAPLKLTLIPKLVEQLHHQTDKYIARYIVRTLNCYPSEVISPVLLDILADKSFSDEIREETIRQLKDHLLTSNIEPLFHLLKTETNERIASLIVSILERFGEPAYSVIEAGLAETNGRHTKAFVIALLRMSILKDSTVPYLLPLLNSTDENLRLLTIELVARADKTLAVETLEELLYQKLETLETDEDYNTLDIVVYLLEKISPETIINHIIHLLSLGKERFQWGILEALDSPAPVQIQGREKAIPLLFKFLYDEIDLLNKNQYDDDEDLDLCQRIIGALGKIGDSSIIQPLLDILHDEKAPKRVRISCIFSIARFSEKKVVDSLITILENPAHKDFWRFAASALAETQDKRAFPHLIRFTQDKEAIASFQEVLDISFSLDKTVDEVIIRALSRLRDERIIPCMIEALGSEDYFVRTAAVRGLGQFKDNQIALEAILQCLRDKAPLVRAVAARELGDIGNKAALPVLEWVKLNDLEVCSQEQVRLDAAKAIEKINTGLN